MKYCRYCGKEIHEKSSFCPYCMQNQIEKQSEIIYEKSSRKWIYLLIAATTVITVIAVLYFALNNDNKKSDNNSSSTIESTEAITTSSTEPISTTVTTLVADTEQTTTKTETTVSTTTTLTTSIETTTAVVTETISQEIILELGEYITEGKSSSQVQGYGGYEDIGGTILTIEDITDSMLTFSITLYSESGYASDTVSVRNITAEIIGNTAEFEFDDSWYCKGAGKLTLENGKIHIETWGETDNPTTIILNEYLTS